MSYNERLHYLGLPGLELRRLHLDLIQAYCYKIVFGLVNLNFSDFFEFSSVTATRGHAYKLYKPSCVNNTRSRYVAERTVNVWNFLRSNVNFSTLNAFKLSIVSIDLSLFLKCITEQVLFVLFQGSYQSHQCPCCPARFVLLHLLCFEPIN